MKKIHNLAALRAFLSAIPPGPVADEGTLIQLLTDCWDEFEGGSDTSMQTQKLHRLESPNWSSPILSFSIERHGATVMGSTRATCYEWKLDIDGLSAKIVGERQRQLTPTARPLDVRPLAKEIADLIVQGRNDPRISVQRDGAIKVHIGAIIPETFAQTTLARRRRFRGQLSAMLEPFGWKERRPNVYVRSPGDR